ncbi:hypothetical protein R9C00_28715 [Flammeovirgaceae bacterium SG7u.111]|nr:hypothetical protein [Flammeovirgaceae bacterium SG7u.132]WPO35684.1 hypothetical protein R9C00_28715 [Flammeovirgaceae bacterium SG7u.111]
MKNSITFLLTFLAINGLWAQEAKPTLLVDGGNKFARKYSLLLEMECKGAHQMMLSTSDKKYGANWEPFEEKVENWPIPHIDGELTVYVQFRDKDANLIGAAKDVIIVDATPPENPVVTIEIPGKLTNDPSLLCDLTLEAKDAKYMMVSNHNTFYDQKWMMYKEEVLDWQLEKGTDGPRTVYVKFRDIAGNPTEVVSDEIQFDTQPPFSCKMVIDDDKRYSLMQNHKGKLSIFAKEADFMKVSHSKDFAGVEWTPFTEELDWTLEGDDGQKIVYAKFKDKAGNESETISDEIFLDTQPPQDCGILIDGGAGLTTEINKIVKLSLKATDAELMMISNHASFQKARWQNFQTTIDAWKLDGEKDGIRRVFVKYKDKAGNITSPFIATIQLIRGIK